MAQPMQRFVNHLFGLKAELTASWISTTAIEEADILQSHGLWVAPGSPYKDLSRALQAIRLARENLVPCLGTCGGTWSLNLPETCSALSMPSMPNTIRMLPGFSSAP
jgi:CTP synthase (UTP-ammonia lyase)